MEHYFLVLSSGPFSEEEQQLALDHVMNLLPPQNCQVKSILPLLRCSSVNIAVVDKYSSADDICWTQITEGLSVKDVLTTAFSNVRTNAEESVASCVSSIHILADHLPSIGTYHLDIIVNGHFAKNFDLNSEILLANALYRLFKLHGGCTSLISIDNIDEKEIEDLSFLSNLRVIRKDDVANFGPLAWRGSWRFRESDNKISVLGIAHELRLSKYNAELKSDEFSMSQYSDLDSTHVVLSPILEPVAFCPFASIPPYLFLPAKFNLYCHDNVFVDDSPESYSHMLEGGEICTIARLGFDYLDRKPGPDAALSGSKWCKMISMSNIKFPESSYPTVKKYITLAFKPSLQRLGVLDAYPLCSTDNLNADFFFTLANHQIEKSLMDPEGDLDSEMDDDFDIPEVPFVGADKVIEFIQTEAETNGNNKVCNLSQRIESFVTSVSSDCEPFTFQNDINVIYDQTDPSDWPERIHLLQKQLREEKEKKYKPNVFLNLSPQRNQFTFSFTCNDAAKYFDSSGKAKNPALDVITVVNGQSNRLRSSIKAPEEIKYTDGQSHPFLDVYYNINNTTEERESMVNELARLFVSHETATTCNKQQANPDCLITVKKKINTPRKSYKSPRKLAENEEMRRKFAEKVKGVIGCKSVTPKNSVALQKPVFEFGRNKTLAKGAVNRKLFEKKQQVLPVRCSPRKKRPVQYSAPSRNSSTVAMKRTESTGLPEITKKKLRVAVASALENNGIGFDDPFFKPCGKRLFIICQTFVQDITHKKGSTSEYMQKIADAHVKQVIEFERQKEI